MKTFGKYDQKGKILETCRMDSVPGGFDPPFLELKAGELALEVEAQGGLKKASCVGLPEKYQVDSRRKKLTLRR